MTQRFESKAGGLQSAQRALDMIEILAAKAPEAVGVTELAQRMHINVTTTHRLLATLVGAGYATRFPDRRYALGPLAARLATQWIEPMVDAAMPMLELAAKLTGQVVHLVQLMGSQGISIGRVIGRQRRFLGIERDRTYPLWATASGKALLSGLSQVEQVSLLPPEPYPAFTPATLRTWKDLKASLAEGRRTGIFLDNGELDRAFVCVAAPLVLSGHSERLAVAVSAPAGPEVVTQLVKVLRAPARGWRSG